MTVTQQKIVEGSHELFYKYGIKRITMDDIARHMGISKKTIYESFSDKDELVLAVASIDFSVHEKQIQKFAKESENAIQEVIMAMHYVSKLFGSMNPNMIYDLQKYHHKAWKLYLDFKNRCISENITGNIKRGIKEDLYRTDLDLKILTQLRLAEMDMSLNPEYYPAHQFHISKVQVELLKHFLFGISTLKGYKLIDKYLKSENN